MAKAAAEARQLRDSAAAAKVDAQLATDAAQKDFSALAEQLLEVPVEVPNELTEHVAAEAAKAEQSKSLQVQCCLASSILWAGQSILQQDDTRLWSRSSAHCSGMRFCCAAGG